ncbi:MAG: hypothetical protein NT027_15615 [Proteobacteria bacterium]|nr:hypothetical protein [Pseudomonadota bacterium]
MNIIYALGVLLALNSADSRNIFSNSQTKGRQHYATKRDTKRRSQSGWKYLNQLIVGIKQR